MPASIGSVTSHGLQRILYQGVIKPYREEKKLREIGLHIRSSADEKGSVLIFKQIWLGPFRLGGENPVIEIKHPYRSSDVVVLNPNYDELGRRVKGYIGHRELGPPEHMTSGSKVWT